MNKLKLTEKYPINKKISYCSKELVELLEVLSVHIKFLEYKKNVILEWSIHWSIEELYDGLKLRNYYRKPGLLRHS